MHYNYKAFNFQIINCVILPLTSVGSILIIISSNLASDYNKMCKPFSYLAFTDDWQFIEITLNQFAFCYFAKELPPEKSTQITNTTGI